MKTKLYGLLLVVVFICVMATNVFAQVKPQVLSMETKKQVVEQLITVMNQNYVFPEISKKTEAMLKKNLKNGRYDAINDPVQFADMLKGDCLVISKDVHFSVQYSPRMTQMFTVMNSQNEEDKKKALEAEHEYYRSENYGFEKIEHMKGNIGYIKFSVFMNTPAAFEKAATAMNFVADCDALIIDLRENMGGSPEMIQFIISYFFSQPTLLNTFYNRPTNTMRESWSLPFVSTKKMANADVYILTSKMTVSAAEEFTYDLINLKRATAIGETTMGGAHPTMTLALSNDFYANVPFERAINPVTKTNWEGAGVKPNIEIAAEKSFDKAYELALEGLMKKAEDPRKKFMLQWTYEGMKSDNSPYQMSEDTMKKFVGTYGERNVYLKDGKLFYRRGAGKEMRMIPMSETKFKVDAVEYFRIEFITEANGSVVTLNGLYDDGRTEPSPKN